MGITAWYMDGVYFVYFVSLEISFVKQNKWKLDEL